MEPLFSKKMKNTEYGTPLLQPQTDLTELCSQWHTVHVMVIQNYAVHQNADSCFFLSIIELDWDWPRGLFDCYCPLLTQPLVNFHVSFSSARGWLSFSSFSFFPGKESPWLASHLCIYAWTSY